MRVSSISAAGLYISKGMGGVSTREHTHTHTREELIRRQTKETNEASCLILDSHEAGECHPTDVERAYPSLL